MLAKLIDAELYWTQKMGDKWTFKDISKIRTTFLKITNNLEVGDEDRIELGNFLFGMRGSKGAAHTNRVGTFTEGDSITGKIKRYFLNNLGLEVSMDKMMSELELQNDRSIGEMIRNIRKGVESIGVEIINVKGVGYRVNIK